MNPVPDTGGACGACNACGACGACGEGRRGCDARAHSRVVGRAASLCPSGARSSSTWWMCGATARARPWPSRRATPQTSSTLPSAACATRWSRLPPHSRTHPRSRTPPRSRRPPPPRRCWQAWRRPRRAVAATWRRQWRSSSSSSSSSTIRGRASTARTLCASSARSPRGSLAQRSRCACAACALHADCTHYALHVHVPCALHAHTLHVHVHVHWACAHCACGGARSR